MSLPIYVLSELYQASPAGCELTPSRFLVTSHYCISLYLNIKLLTSCLKQNFILADILFISVTTIFPKTSSTSSLSSSISNFTSFSKTSYSFFANFSHIFLFSEFFLRLEEEVVRLSIFSGKFN